MTIDHRQRVFAAADQDDITAPLAVFREALAWTIAALAAITTEDDDRVALSAAVQLDDALDQLPALVALVPPLADRAEAGAPARNRIAQQIIRTTSTTSRSRIAALRREVEAAQAVKETHRAQLAEQTELRERLVDLRRLERLSMALRELESQRQVIDDRLRLLAQPVTNAEQALARGTVDLVRLSESRLELLRPEIKLALDRARTMQDEVASAERSVREQEQAIAEMTDRRDQLCAAHQERTTALQVHVRADQKVAAALAQASTAVAPPEDAPGLHAVTGALNDIQSRLAEIDRVLGEALTSTVDGDIQPAFSYGGHPLLDGD